MPRVTRVVYDPTIDPTPPTAQADLALDAASYAVRKNNQRIFNILRTESTADRVSVDWAITNANVIPFAGTEVFEIGETSKAVAVNAQDIGPTEYGTLSLSNPQNLSGGPTPALISPSVVGFTIQSIVISPFPDPLNVTVGQIYNVAALIADPESIRAVSSMNNIDVSVGSYDATLGNERLIALATGSLTNLELWIRDSA